MTIAVVRIVPLARRTSAYLRVKRVRRTGDCSKISAPFDCAAPTSPKRGSDRIEEVCVAEADRARRLSAGVGSRGIGREPGRDDAGSAASGLLLSKRHRVGRSAGVDEKRRGHDIRLRREFLQSGREIGGALLRDLPRRARDATTGNGFDTPKRRVRLRQDRAEAAGSRSRCDAIGFEQHHPHSRGREHVRGGCAGEAAANDDGVSRVGSAKFRMGTAAIVGSALSPITTSITWHLSQHNNGVFDSTMEFRVRSGSRFRRFDGFRGSVLVPWFPGCQRTANPELRNPSNPELGTAEPERNSEPRTSRRGVAILSYRSTARWSSAIGMCSSSVCASVTEPGPNSSGVPQRSSQGMSVVNEKTAVSMPGHGLHPRRRHDQDVLDRHERAGVPLDEVA